MKPSEFRANMSGYLDGSATLINEVIQALEAGMETQTKAGPKINCPPQVLDELNNAVDIIDRCSEWLLSEHNQGFEK
jgi:hypothetical protein